MDGRYGWRGSSYRSPRRDDHANSTFLAVAAPFLVVGLAFAVLGEFVFWSTFLTLGVVFLTLGLVTDRDDAVPPEQGDGSGDRV